MIQAEEKYDRVLNGWTAFKIDDGDHCRKDSFLAELK
jgi:hypothetical protein